MIFSCLVRIISQELFRIVNDQFPQDSDQNSESCVK